MIKAICFDLDGVYFNASGFEGFKNSLEGLGASKEDINYYLHGRPMNGFKRGEISEDAYWNALIDYLGIKVTKDGVKEMLIKNYIVDAEVHSLAIRAREAGYKTCLCSNNFITRIEMLNEKFSFLKEFDVSVFSYEVGELKPSDAIFQELLRRLEVKPEELVYFDDNEDKLLGAQSLGVNTFVFENLTQIKKELLELGVNL